MKLALTLASILSFTSVIFAQEIPYPGEYEYQALDQPAEALNYPEVRHAMGIPIAALRADQPLQVHCRVLVDDHGRYVRHSVHRVDHPDLIGTVSLHLPNLQFLPAEKNQERISSWVNLPIVFDHGLNRSGRQSPQLWFNLGLSQAKLPPTKIEEVYASAEQQKWVETVGLATQLLQSRQGFFRRNLAEDHIELYYLRAMALLSLGIAEEAHLDINEGIAMAREEADLIFETRFRSLRLISWMIKGGPVNLIVDYSFICENWQKEIAWKTWEPLLESDILIESIYARASDYSHFGLPDELNELLQMIRYRSQSTNDAETEWSKLAGTQ